MATINEFDFKKQLKNKTFSSIYLFYGSESYLKDMYIKRLKKSLIDPSFEDFNFHSYEGSNLCFENVLQDAQVMPMFSEHSMLLVHDFSFDESEDYELLKEYCKDIPEQSVLVLWYDRINAHDKKSKMSKVVTLVSKYGDCVLINQRDEHDNAKTLVSYAKKCDKELDIKIANYLISVVGNDLQTLFNELEKAINYSNEYYIDKSVIDAVCTKSLEARIFDLSKYIIRGESDKALKSLNSLLEMKEEPIVILHIIASNYIDLYRAKCATTVGKSTKNVIDDFSYGSRPFVVNNAFKDCRSLSLEKIRSCIDLLSNTDSLLKSTAIDKNILLEETVVKLIAMRD